MNTGIGDAVNLAWKLAAVLQRTCGRVAPRQLRAGAHRLRPAAGRDDRSGVHRRDERRRRSPGWCDCGIVPLLFPLLFEFPIGAAVDVPHGLADGGELPGKQPERGARGSRCRAATVCHGWKRPERRGPDNFAPLTSLDWQVHVYGDAAPPIRAVCEARQLPLHVFPWRPEMGRHRLAPRCRVSRATGRLYRRWRILTGSAAAITSYLDARKLKPRTPS